MSPQLEEQEQTEEQDETTQGPADWDAYVASLPEDQQALVTKLYSDKNQGLLNTVKATRDERDTFASQLRDAAKKLEKGSDAEQQLTQQADQLDAANKRADFYESAQSHDCKNPKAAFAIAMAGNHFTKAGLPDWKAIQADAPELFGIAAPKPKGKAHAGDSTEREAPSGGTINDFIRARAGVIPDNE